MPVSRAVRASAPIIADCPRTAPRLLVVRSPTWRLKLQGQAASEHIHSRTPSPRDRGRWTHGDHPREGLPQPAEERSVADEVDHRLTRVNGCGHRESYNSCCRGRPAGRRGANALTSMHRG